MQKKSRLLDNFTYLSRRIRMKSEASTQNKPGAPVALSESSLWRYASFTALYIAQGLPHGLLTIALPAWLAAQGFSVAQIGGFIALVTLPWSLKLVGGPLIDRFGFLPMGRRRPWVLGAQLGLLLSFALMAAVSDPAANLDLVAAMGFIVSLCGALQDVAVDGMAIDILPENQRTRANGFMYGGKALGIAASSSLGGIVLSKYGFSPAVLLIAGLLALIMLFPLLLRERPGERLLPWTPGKTSTIALQLQLNDLRSIVRGLLRAFLLPMSLVTAAMIFVFRMSEGLLETILPVLTVQQLSWEHTDYSQLMAVAGLIAGATAMLLGATVVEKVGRLRTIFIANILLIVLALAAGSLPHLWPSHTLASAYVILTQMIYVTVAVVFLATFMGMCWKRVAATQFTLYMALANLGYSAGAALAGPLKAVFEYNHIFFVLAGIGVATLALLYFVDLEAHQKRIADLDAKPLDSGDVGPTPPPAARA
jgi:PAT family beta-lactamase induction signal transducer AmpG